MCEGRLSLPRASLCLKLIGILVSQTPRSHENSPSNDELWRPKTLNHKIESIEGEVRRSNETGLDLLLRGNIIENRGAAFGKDFVPEFGNPPHDGEDDTFPNQHTEHISRNLPTVLAWVQELVGFIYRAVRSAWERTREDKEEDGR